MSDLFSVWHIARHMHVDDTLFYCQALFPISKTLIKRTSAKKVKCKMPSFHFCISNVSPSLM